MVLPGRQEAGKKKNIFLFPSFMGKEVAHFFDPVFHLLQ